MSMGSSGTRVTSAPPAMPTVTAIQPASRPMTSTTWTRLWASVVECRRSTASVAIITAVSKPKQTSVPERSLSMVLGTPMQFTPRLASSTEMDCVSSPPMAMSASSLCLASDIEAAVEAAFDLFDVGAGGAQDGPAAMQDAAGGLEIERHGAVFDDAAPALHEADKLIAVVLNSLANCRPNHCIEPWTIPTTRQHPDPHLHPPTDE